MKVLVLDLETKAPGHTGEDFPPLAEHRITTACWLKADAQAGEFALRAFDAESLGEYMIIEKLAEDLASADRLVTFNGRSFDLPLVVIRACGLGVDISSLKDKMHRFESYKKELWHHDVMELYGNYGAARGISLSALSRSVLGRDKTGDGAIAAEMTAKNRLEYCSCDVYLTYALYLRHARYVIGAKSADAALARLNNFGASHALLAGLKLAPESEPEAQEEHEKVIVSATKEKFDAVEVKGSPMTKKPPYVKEVSDEPSECRKCKEVIYWSKSHQGKNIPLNEDGSVHFETCKGR